MALTIRSISTPVEKRQFVRMMWDIYANDPNWLAPIEMDRMKLMDEKKNPFYKHADAKWFVAERDGKIVGRIGAIINHSHNTLYHEKSGFFGFFECENDPETAQALFSSAEQYLKDAGMTQCYGPANPSSNDEYGLLVEGFDRPPVMLMTYNPPYYDRLIMQNGYTKHNDLYAWLLSQETAKSDKLVRVANALKERNNITIRPIRKDHFDEDVELVKYIYNTAWENDGFVPLTDDEMNFMVKDLKQVYDPDLVLFAELNGKPVGFALSLPDINQSLFKGKRIPKGFMNLPVAVWKLLTQKKAINTVRILILGVLKEYRGRGVDALLYLETMDRAKRKGYEFGEASWVQEGNLPMNRAAQMMNGERYKTYRIYKKSLV
jgi:GNAT superfamily N-acetyltransferase